MRKWMVPAICLAAPGFLLLNSACGIFTYPVDGTSALAQNAQVIKFTVAIVDESGTPLDDVKVAVERITAEADMWLPDVYTKASERPSTTVSGSFSFDELGLVCARVTFEKAGYAKTQLLYANTDQFTERQFRFNGMPNRFACINVSKSPLPPVVLKRVEIPSAK